MCVMRNLPRRSRHVCRQHFNRAPRCCTLWRQAWRLTPQKLCPISCHLPFPRHLPRRPRTSTYSAPISGSSFLSVSSWKRARSLISYFPYSFRSRQPGPIFPVNVKQPTPECDRLLSLPCASRHTNSSNRVRSIRGVHSAQTRAAGWGALETADRMAAIFLFSNRTVRETVLEEPPIHELIWFVEVDFFPYIPDV